MSRSEWSPLWAIPVVPLPGTEEPLEKKVRRLYPGPLETMRIVPLRRLGAALLVPRVQLSEEADLPIPALLLNRRGMKKTGLVHAPTSRGFDVYQLRKGKLCGAWSSERVPPESWEIPVPGKTRGLLRRDLLRSERIASRKGTYLALTLLLLAAVLRVVLDQLPPLPSDSTAGRALEVTPPVAAATRKVLPLPEVLEEVVQLHRHIPGFALEAIEVGPGGQVVRFTTTQPPESVLEKLNGLGFEEAGRRHHVQGADRVTRVTLEGRYER